MLELGSARLLISKLRRAKRDFAFVIGSALSRDSDGGVPGVEGILELARERVEVEAPELVAELARTLEGKNQGERYQAVMGFLRRALDNAAADEVVDAAVRRALKDPEAKFSDDGEPDDWYLPRGLRDLARVVDPRGRYKGPILTTNFDPLVLHALRRRGHAVHRRVLSTDGSLDEVKDSNEVLLVHLHGYWRESDLLHTRAQLTGARAKLEQSVCKILRDRIVVVIGYGGWDDVFLEALANAANADGDPIEILWCLYEADAGRVEHAYGKLLRVVAPLIQRGRFHAYGGIDCHSIFDELCEFDDSDDSAARPSDAASPKTPSKPPTPEPSLYDELRDLADSIRANQPADSIVKRFRARAKDSVLELRAICDRLEKDRALDPSVRSRLLEDLRLLACFVIPRLPRLQKHTKDVRRQLKEAHPASVTVRTLLAAEIVIAAAHKRTALFCVVGESIIGQPLLPVGPMRDGWPARGFTFGNDEFVRRAREYMARCAKCDPDDVNVILQARKKHGGGLDPCFYVVTNPEERERHAGEWDRLSQAFPDLPVLVVGDEYSKDIEEGLLLDVLNKILRSDPNRRAPDWSDSSA